MKTFRMCVETSLRSLWTSQPMWLREREVRGALCVKT